MSVNKVYLKELYLDKKLSIPEISEIVGMSRSNIRYHLLKQGVKLRSREEWMPLVRHKLGAHLRGKHHTHSEDAKRKMSESKKLFWKDKAKGYRVHLGYKVVTQGENCGRPLHSVLMEEHIGRKLKKNEVVHHINGNKQDNRIENLRLMTRAEHARLHCKQRVLSGEFHKIPNSVRIGEDHPCSKLNWEKVEYIRSSNMKYSDLAKMFGVSKSAIKHIKSFRNWRTKNVS